MKASSSQNQFDVITSRCQWNPSNCVFLAVTYTYMPTIYPFIQVMVNTESLKIYNYNIERAMRFACNCLESEALGGINIFIETYTCTRTITSALVQ